MLRYLFNRKIFEKKIGLGQYSLKLNYFTRFFNVRIILSILVLLFIVFILKIWSECFTIRKNFFSNLFHIDNKTSFGEYNYVFSRETILERRSSRFHNITVAQSGSLRMLRFDTLSGVASNFWVLGNFLINFFEEWAILGNLKSIGPFFKCLFPSQKPMLLKVELLLSS